MSKTTGRDAADQANLSPSRALDGISKDAAAIPAVTPAADRRSDSGFDVTNTAVIAPPARTSRRGFLMNSFVSAAAIATATAIPAQSTAAFPADLPLPRIPSPASDDPIFAAIEAHRTAIDVHREAVNTEMTLEVSLPDDQRQSDITVWEETIVESDDPAWLAAIRSRWETSNVMDDLAIELLNIEPTTMAGAEALLRYFVDQEKALFPDDVGNDDGSVEAFGASLVRHAADALHNIARPSPV